MFMMKIAPQTLRDSRWKPKNGELPTKDCSSSSEFSSPLVILFTAAEGAPPSMSLSLNVSLLLARVSGRVFAMVWHVMMKEGSACVGLEGPVCATWSVEARTPLARSLAFCFASSRARSLSLPPLSRRPNLKGIFHWR